MRFLDYLNQYWGLLIMLGGLLLYLHGNVHLEKGVVISYLRITVVLFVYSATEYTEYLLGIAENFTPLRSWISAVNYTLVSLIIVQVIRLMYAKRNWLIYVPLLVNAACCFISIFNGMVFWFTTEDNKFHRGPLGYLPYVVAAVYMVYLFYRLFRDYGGKMREDLLVVIYMLVTCMACFILPLVWQEQFYRWFCTTIAMNVFVYYVFILHQYTKRDTLTGLLNRQTYTADIEKRGKSVTALIALDMNGLKELNDRDGHTAGDTALAALGKAMLRCMKDGQRMYRIGGDEFAALCFHTSREDVEKLVAALRESIGETPFTCSIGYAYTDTPRPLDDLYKEADAALYVEKERYYRETGKERRKV